MVRCARRPLAPHGYTLVELLIIITILGIAGTMVIPQIGSTDVLRVQAAVRTIVADINYMQSDALARQQSRAIVFDPANNSYSLLEVPGDVLDPINDLIYAVDFKNSKKFHSATIVSAQIDGDEVLVFDEMASPILEPGSAAPSAGGRITVTGSGSTFHIDVEAYTGRVTVTKVAAP